MKLPTGKQMRKLIASATEGDVIVKRKIPITVKFSNPRFFDEFADFEVLQNTPGIYIIYSVYRPKILKDKSRILYIGRGWIGNRLSSHLNKRGLKRFAQNYEVKFVFAPVGDEDWEFILEGILLNVHWDVFWDLPKYNNNPGSSTLLGWRRVMTWQPGPRRIINKYGL